MPSDFLINGHPPGSTGYPWATWIPGRTGMTNRRIVLPKQHAMHHGMPEDAISIYSNTSFGADVFEVEWRGRPLGGIAAVMLQSHGGALLSCNESKPGWPAWFRSGCACLWNCP